MYTNRDRYHIIVAIVIVILIKYVLVFQLSVHEKGPQKTEYTRDTGARDELWSKRRHARTA
jgi:hypothetical protein